MRKAIFKYEGPRVNRKDLTLDLNDDDEIALWLMRMCYSEGGKKCTWTKATVMLWAMARRWMLHSGRADRVSFLRLVRHRCRRGDNIRRKYEHTRDKRRQLVCDISRDRIPSIIRIAVLDFIRGDVRMHDLHATTRLSDWTTDTSEARRKHPKGRSLGGLWFFDDKCMVDGTVVVDYILDDL